MAMPVVEMPATPPARGQDPAKSTASAILSRDGDEAGEGRGSTKGRPTPKGQSNAQRHSAAAGPSSAPCSSSANETGPAGEASKATADPDRPVRKRRRSSASQDKSEVSTRKETFGAALARSLAGSAAFIFRAPVRVFRPSKLSSWSLLEAMAKREGKPLSLRYLRTLVRRERSTFLPHLLLPPILFNTAIGFILFESYSVVESRLLAIFYPRREVAIEAHNEAKANGAGGALTGGAGEQAAAAVPEQPFTPLWIVAIAGGSAGFAQSILSSPLDNVRLLITSAAAVTSAGGPDGARKNLRISWSNIFKSAILPFAPASTRERIADEVRASASKALGGSSTSASSSTASSAGNSSRFKLTSTATLPRDAKGNIDWTAVKAASQRWEKAVARLRGGMHGAGLVLSVVRDSVGYASFFFTFECSRRLAYASSRAVDAAIAFWNGTAALPQLGGGFTATGAEVVTDEYRLGRGRSRSDTEVLQKDVSLTSSRTRAGRFVAGFVLLCGGTLGAVIYELVGRPAELMREVVWRGRAKWAEGKQKRADASGASQAKAHTTSSAAWTGGGGRSAVIGARVARELKSEAQGAFSRPGRRYSSFLELRAGNSAGSGTSRLSSARTLAHPQHPLKPRAKDLPAQMVVKAKATLNSQPQAPAERKLRPAREGGRSARSPTAPLKPEHLTPSAKHTPAEPVLERRPTAVQLLIEHARRNSSLRFTTSNRDAQHTTPVPLPVLLVHTYFVAPFLMGETVRSLTAKVTHGAGLDGGSSMMSKKADASSGSQAASATTTASKSHQAASTPEEAMRRNWMMRNRVSSIFGNRLERWRNGEKGSSSSTGAPSSSSGTKAVAAARAAGRSAESVLSRWPRMTFALRRLANPYGIAFLTFAWLGGDLA